ncbi:MAG: flagellar hook-basal body complex protein FliE [Fluviicoccus sp.]|uniref:flagellar hook-basal body complex protein FliE n=1 Tax=Fluviicoccus sp. TaxID=2003552 RepID=UPI0027170C9C|nr:flagellar hook-basal body complex protein FliE [Fluviicoccus sp.]MDO8330485.1 flagellar hook-basal body complex protein FliE [Fluviicoccus sp.]
MSLITPVMPVSLESISGAGTIGQSAPSSDFGKIMMDGLAEVEKSSRNASTALAAFAAGEDISPHDLVIAMEQAKLTLQLSIEIRNRMVEAYQELSRLQI